MAASLQKSALSPSGDRELLLQRFGEARARTTELTAPLSTEDQTIQSMPDVSPTKWHLAHTTWFFETFVLASAIRDYTPFDARFGYLFNSYYEAEGPRHPRPERGLISRPSLEEVHDWRAHVDEAVQHLAQSIDQRGWRKLRPTLELGLQHEQQHQELILMDIKHVLSRNPLLPSYGAVARKNAEARPPSLRWLSFPGGLYAIGSDHDEFAFDNEGPSHRVWLEPFRLASRLATNREFLAFIDDGGYRRAKFWLSEGWQVVQHHKWEAPLYWGGEAGARMLFTLGGERPLDPDEPVSHVSYYEADAFARWSGKRLPREDEWEIAARHAPTEGHFASSGEFHPRPASGDGLTQMFGDLWEWTSSAYAAYPGFRPAAGALGEYNGKFMCGQFVLRGGAAVTPGAHVRASYRNFYPPGARWAFSGTRLADDDA